MSQQETKYTVSFDPAFDADPALVESWSPEKWEQSEAVLHKLVRNFYQIFDQVPPERGSVTIQWERESPSTTTPPESN